MGNTKKLPAIDVAAAAKTANADVEEASEALAHIEPMTIESQADLRFAVALAAEVKERAAAVDAKRVKITDAARLIIDEVDKLFKPAVASLVKCEKLIKDKIVAYDVGLAVKRERLLTEASEAAKEEHDEDAGELLKLADACVPEKIKGLSLRRSTKVEIVDAQSAIDWCVANGRWELLQINERAIKALAKASSYAGVRIPGVNVAPSTVAAITVGEVER